jgi:hypothetical protein
MRILGQLQKIGESYTRLADAYDQITNNENEID